MPGTFIVSCVLCHVSSPGLSLHIVYARQHNRSLPPHQCARPGRLFTRRCFERRKDRGGGKKHGGGNPGGQLGHTEEGVFPGRQCIAPFASALALVGQRRTGPRQRDPSSLFEPQTASCGVFSGHTLLSPFVVWSPARLVLPERSEVCGAFCCFCLCFSLCCPVARGFVRRGSQAVGPFPGRAQKFRLHPRPSACTAGTVTAQAVPWVVFV